jgi:hypothetical protein
MWRAVQFNLKPSSADNARATTHPIRYTDNAAVGCAASAQRIELKAKAVMASNVAPRPYEILVAGNVRFTDRDMKSNISIVLVMLPKAQYLVLSGPDFARKHTIVAGRIHILCSKCHFVSRRYFDLMCGNLSTLDLQNGPNLK